jgi:hypothetical protein
MLFIAITLGFVVVVTGCMILINRWMVSQRPPVSEEDPDQDDDGLNS